MPRFLSILLPIPNCRRMKLLCTLYSLKRYSGVSGFRGRGRGTVGRSVLWVANGWAGVPARFEMLRHREDAADVPQRTEFDAALPEHVASGKRSEEVRAAIRANESEDAVCRSSPGARDQRVCLLGV